MKFDSNVLQTLIRAVLKFAGGFLIARGLADENSVEVITAGLVTLAAVLWGVWHRTPPPSEVPAPRQLPLLLVALLPVFMLGACATPNGLAFRSEKLATDSAHAALLAWKAYYAVEFTNRTGEDLDSLARMNARVYAASRQFAASMLAADAIREECATNADLGRAALDIPLQVAQNHSSNLVFLVGSFMRSDSLYPVNLEAGQGSPRLPVTNRSPSALSTINSQLSTDPASPR